MDTQTKHQHGNFQALQGGRVSRVRIEAIGPSGSAVGLAMGDAARGIVGRLKEQFGIETAYGEEVLERDLRHQGGDGNAWRGRLNLHPDLIGETGQVGRSGVPLGYDPDEVSESC